MKFQPEVIYIEQGADDYTLTREVLRRFSNAPVLKNVDAQAVMDEINKTATDTFGTAKKRLLLCAKATSLSVSFSPGSSEGANRAFFCLLALRYAI